MSYGECSHLDPAARIKLLCSQGDSLVVDPNIPLRRYFRSGLEMVRMANVYAEEGSYENAFILYMKFMTLFLEKIRGHPEFSGHSSIDKTNNTKKLKEILPKAEQLKAILRDKYQKEYNIVVKEQKLLEEKLKQKQLEQQRLTHEQAEKRRLEEEEEEQRRRDIEEEEQRIRNVQSFHHNHPKTTWEDAPPAYDNVESLAYPVSALSLVEQEENDARNSPSVPSRNLKPLHLNTPTTPSFDRSSKPMGLLGAKSGGLRDVIVPEELMAKFMSLAQPNTLCNIETCGILAGKLAQNQLLLTHLLVPKQCGTSDSCTTQQEEEIFDFQDKLDLITIGWIHTHPTQTAFLSSVDLHTHCSYQLMMPEAVAIVCAPKYEETGYFTLTPNHGLSYIASCTQSGFHPHPKEPPLFQGADHVKLDRNSSITVIDLRN